ncbi:uncharacterized protein LOC126812608 [Patella vulgata]|uniref:uncharacterized protein LOC126812608 n=1 Tax=Patella vulgata TaxID=6465 RepID=UPI0024A9955D|nr:uncharacterized protein LOC126812608 [Patella vulgata]
MVGKLTNNTLLCSDHFADRNGPSPLFAIPSVFPTKIFKITLTYDDVCSEDSKVFFYTGIPDKKTFDAIFDELKDDAETKTSRKTPCKVPTTSGRPRALRLIDEFFLV